jgi:hypothetical protein
MRSGLSLPKISERSCLWAARVWILPLPEISDFGCERIPAGRKTSLRTSRRLEWAFVRSLACREHEGISVFRNLNRIAFKNQTPIIRA